ncbi:hypothetical protein GBA52_016499 [Prunus armeniaca]|nr:hypothetical protein GBA52_016499 [Prunus armeniaca]
MAESVVSFLLDRLASIIEDEVRLLSGTRAEMEDIVEELERIKAFLRVADAKEDSDPQLKVWVKQVRDVAYQIEDALDIFRLSHSCYHRPGCHVSLHELSCMINKLKARRRIATDIQGIKSKVRSLYEGHQNYKLDVDLGSSKVQKHQYSQGDALLLEEADLVAIGEPKRQLIELLMQEGGHAGRQAVAVVGMGGLGKTTLAKQVYKDARVKKNFKVHAWITVSQSFKIKKLLRHIVEKIFKVIRKPVPEEVDRMDTNQLREKIKKLLQHSKYLIVLDDLWHIDAWNVINHALPDNKGSRVMITTRNAFVASVASASCMNNHGMVYHLEPLSPEESWTLLCRKTFQEESCPPNLKEICQCILRKCGGLPLAIVAIGAVLAMKDKKNIEDWAAVSGSIAIQKEQGTMWPEKVRRLSIVNTLQNVQQKRVPSKLRSLLIFGVEDSLTEFSIPKLFPRGLPLLTVLDLEGAPLETFPKEVVNLLLLRYLSLRGTRVKQIPSSIKKLQNLETFDLKHSHVVELPAEILNLKRLRHLLVYRYEVESYARFNSRYGVKVPAGICGLQSLQKLCFVEANQDNGALVAELGRMNQLRRLGIFKLRQEDGVTLCSSIEKMRNLRSLSVSSVEKDKIIDLTHISCPPQFLQRLYLTGRLENLPHWISSLQNVVRLFLKWSRLKEDPLVHLQGLPNLVHLELLQVYEGDCLHFKAGGFPSLKLLGIDKLDELKLVIMDEGAMPCLEKLIIQRCRLLKKVSGIEHLQNLKLLEFFDMPDELIRPFHPYGGEDHWKVAHIPEVYSSYWNVGGWDVYSLEITDGESTSHQGTTSAMRRLEPNILWKA